MDFYAYKYTKKGNAFFSDTFPKPKQGKIYIFSSIDDAKKHALLHLSDNTNCIMFHKVNLTELKGVKSRYLDIRHNTISSWKIKTPAIDTMVEVERCDNYSRFKKMNRHLIDDSHKSKSAHNEKTTHCILL